MMTGARVDAEDGWHVGEDKTLRFTVRDDDGKPVNATGWTASYAIHRRRAAHDAVPLWSTSVVGGSSGRLDVEVPAEATAGLQPGTYEHVLRRTDPGARAVLAHDSISLGGAP